MKKSLLFLLISNIIFAQFSISSSERNALEALYNSTNGSNWSTKWDFEKDPKFWYGIKIKNGYVSEINLAGNALKGNFPSVSAFSKLEKLDLSSNVLSGNLSPSVSGLSNLKRLDISYNALTGDPSNSLVPLTNLQELSIGNNDFTISNIESFLQGFTNLNVLDLSKLGLTSIPQKISSFQQLTTLILNKNKISQNFNYLNGLLNLTTLDLSENQLTTIPVALTANQNLRTLNLARNTFGQNYATALNSLKNLEWLSLEGNQITNIPQELTGITNLIHLNLGRNKISSTSSLTSLKNLEQLYLNDNELSGDFPTDLLQLTKLQMLNVSSNKLSGSIPINTPNITQLENNRFTKDQLTAFLEQNRTMADFPYSPQRYDEEKTVSAGLGESINLTQSLSSTDYQFSWLKHLDQNLNIHSANYSINSVSQDDYAKYTVEAYLLKEYPNYLLEVSFFREPITLIEGLGTEEVMKGLSIFPNPTKDYLHIRNQNLRITKSIIYDTSGKQAMTSTQNTIDVRHLPSGVYLILIETEAGLKTFKWIKE